MRSNSGGGKSVNNNHDVTLRDKEREKGVSGEAIRGERKVKAKPSRTSAREEQTGG